MFTQEFVNNLPMESLLTPAAGSMAEANATAMAPAGGASYLSAGSSTSQNQMQRDAWFDRAQKVMPWGVSSNFRYWGPDDTMVVARGKGAHLWDVDGNRYIDYRLGFGPVILGHAHDVVTRAVFEAMQDG